MKNRRYVSCKPVVVGAIATFLTVAGSVYAGSAAVGPGDDVRAAVEALRPGDTLRIAAGFYSQPIVIRAKGTAQKPITVTGATARASVTGLAELKLEWTAAANGVFTAKTDHPVTQLFADGKLLTPARWPNMTFAERWDNSKWPASDKGTVYGTMIDSELADSGLDFTGCVAILNIGSWQTFRRVITAHAAGSDRFTYPTKAGSRLHKAKHPDTMNRYCIYGKAALDVPGEWYWDKATSALHLIPPAGRAPSSLKLESKRIAEAIVVENSQHVIVSNLKLRGTTIRMSNVRNCTLRDVDIEYGTAIANPFGPNLPHPAVKARTFSARKWFGETSLDTLTEVQGNDNVIRNLTVRFSEGPAITVGGDRNIVENCLFKDIDWHGLDYGFGVDLLAAGGVTVRRVTLDHCGGSEGLRLPNHGKSLVEYCHLHHCGLRQSDGGIIQTSTAKCSGTEIRYNWIHDHNAFHWGGNGIRGDDGTRGLLIHHNVVWNCREKGIVTKGDGNKVYNNTCFNNPRIDILMPRNRLPGKVKELKRQNVTSRAFNNIGKVTGSWTWEKPKKPPHGETSHNAPASADILVDSAKMDFRLNPGAEQIDAGIAIEGVTDGFEGKAPDLGAHEFDGKPAWEAGYKAPQ